MFNIVNRAQAVSNQALTCSMVLAGLVVIASIIQLFQNGAWSINSTEISNVVASALEKGSSRYGASNGVPKENSIIKFDLEADLTPLFNWNTKQVFVYLTAEYPGKSAGSANKVTYWDKIITSKDDAIINLHNERSKYSVWDFEKSFRQRDAILSLEWNVQPHIGPLIFGKTETTTPFTFADVKQKS